MAKKNVYIKKELVDYKCKVCDKMVIVSLAREWTIETDTSIIHTWDYGHQHKKVFEIIDETQLLVEDTVYYD